MRNRRNSLSILLITVLLFTGSALADRRHGDVENIGNRDINGRVALIFPNFVSLEKEIQIGAQYAQYFEQRGLSLKQRQNPNWRA